MTKLRCIWDGKAELGEGIFWHEGEHAVYWVDIIQSKLHRLTNEGNVQNWHFPGQISSVVPCNGGGLLATFENGLSHLDLDTATITPLVSLESELPGNRFNDGCSDTRGQFWFGSMDDHHRDPSGSFYCLDGNGNIEKLSHFGQMCVSNGPAFSTDGQWVYFTDSLKRCVYRAPLDENGKAGTPELHIIFSKEDGFPDGMCADTAGGLWICHFGGSRVTRFGQDGRIDQIVAMPVPNITKCAFGGPDLQTLYVITAASGLDQVQKKTFPQSGGLFAIDLPYSGLAARAVTRPAISL